MKPAVQNIYEKMVQYYSAAGLSPSASKVFAWLTLCEPSAQTADDIQKATGVSAGGVSEATSMLTKVGIVVRHRRPGERRYYYEMTKASVAASMEQRIAMSIAVRDLAGEAIAVLPDNERLAGMYGLYDLLSLRLPEIVEEFRQSDL